MDMVANMEVNKVPGNKKLKYAYIVVAFMVPDMEVDMVADMGVDKVADKVADMVAAIF